MRAEFGFGPSVEELAQRAALTCWEHLYGWPAVRDMAAQLRARGSARHADLLLEAARHTRPPVFRWTDPHVEWRIRDQPLGPPVAVQNVGS